MNDFYDVIVLGAGASGLMCALEAGKRGRKVLVIDHANKIGSKIRISGGGRCNFTNKNVQSHNYLSANGSFCQSALQRFTQWDFLKIIEQAQIPYEERSHGQLFGTASARVIVDALVQLCENAGVEFLLESDLTGFAIEGPARFSVEVKSTVIHCASFVVASGGLSYTGLGASGIGHYIAEQANLGVVATKPGLVPLTWNRSDSLKFVALAGIAQMATASLGNVRFTENVLFTHRGLSGPVILQISSFWTAGDVIQLNLLPGVDLFAQLKSLRVTQGPKLLRTVLQEWLPKRLITSLLSHLPPVKMADCSDKIFKECVQKLQQWQIQPAGTEGFAKAEVTCGGVDTHAISSKTMEAIAVPGLYFTGEVLDVTGWLGGYNLQWAWASGWCAGQYA